jgi:hypothetical protein
LGALLQRFEIYWQKLETSNMISSPVQEDICSVIVVGYEGYCKPIQQEYGSGKWGVYKSDRNKPGC